MKKKREEKITFENVLKGSAGRAHKLLFDLKRYHREMSVARREEEKL